MSYLLVIAFEPFSRVRWQFRHFGLPSSRGTRGIAGPVNSNIDQDQQKENKRHLVCVPNQSVNHIAQFAVCGLVECHITLRCVLKEAVAKVKQVLPKSIQPGVPKTIEQ
jgi:hypothetical protein